MDVELRHLRALVTIADEGTVTAAAARLHLTQPALSRTLARLEHHVGVTLVDRSSRRLALTPAGRTLYEHGRAILAHVDAALADTAAVSRPLRLGYSCAVLGRSTVPLVRSWRRDHPHVPLELRRRDEGTAGLATGETDAAVIRADPGDPRLRVIPLYTEDRFAALPDNHPLAARPEVTLAELSGETLTLWREDSTSGPALWGRERRPATGTAVQDVDEWLNVIAVGDSIGVAAAGTAESHAHPGVRFVRISDAEPAVVYLAHPTQPTHPSTHDLVLAVKELVSADVTPVA
ncbi:LysR substrate-binding domain-containing protein [Streptomyces sp. URMC 126]|uniref:LysR substrate-binding domain-containing protein n=1 Tax=Streptomyces sp. URMC 126 TaxID=3423401 RepID=UPI003F19878F